MQIQSIGKTTAFTKVQANSDNSSNIDAQIKSLTKQVENLQKQINDLEKQNNKSAASSNIVVSGSSKVVQDQIKELQSQITEINSEIAKLQSEKYSHKNEEVQEKKADTLDEKLVKCGNTMSDLKTQYSTKIKLQGSANVLKCEIEIDKARGVDTTKKEEELSNMKQSIRKIEKDMGKNIQKSLKEGKKEVILEKNEGDSEDLNKYTEEDYKSNFLDERA